MQTHGSIFFFFIHSPKISRIFPMAGTKLVGGEKTLPLSLLAAQHHEKAWWVQEKGTVLRAWWGIETGLEGLTLAPPLRALQKGNRITCVFALHLYFSFMMSLQFSLCHALWHLTVILLTTRVLFHRQFLVTWTNLRYPGCLFFFPTHPENTQSQVSPPAVSMLGHCAPPFDTHLLCHTGWSLSLQVAPQLPRDPPFRQLVLALFSTFLRLLTSSSPLPFSADHLASELTKKREATWWQLFQIPCLL